MTIEIDESKLAGLNAIVSKIVAELKPEDETVTPQSYLESRINDLLSSYNQQLIDQAKKDYENVITLAAGLSDEKKAQAIDFIQKLAADQ